MNLIKLFFHSFITGLMYLVSNELIDMLEYCCPFIWFIDLFVLYTVTPYLFFQNLVTFTFPSVLMSHVFTI